MPFLRIEPISLGCSRLKGNLVMFAIIGAVLIVCWLLGFIVFHVSSALIHLLIVVGIIMLIVQFVSGRRA